MLVKPLSAPPLSEKMEQAPSWFERCRAGISAGVEWVRQHFENIIRRPGNEDHPLVEFYEVGCAILGTMDKIREWLAGTLGPLKLPARSGKRTSYILPGAMATLLGIATTYTILTDQIRQVYTPGPVPPAAKNTAPGQRRIFAQLPTENILGLPFVEVDTKGKDITAEMRIDDVDGIYFLVNKHKFVIQPQVPEDNEIAKRFGSDPKKLIKSVERSGQDTILIKMIGDVAIAIPVRETLLGIVQELEKQKEPSPTMEVSVSYRLTIPKAFNLIRQVREIPREGRQSFPLQVYYPGVPHLMHKQ